MSSPMFPYTWYARLKSPIQTVSWFCILLTVIVSSAFGQQPQVLLGGTNVESSVDSNPSGTAEAFPVQAGATGQVNSLSVYLDSSSRAATVWVGMYSNFNGHPRVLLATGVISNPLAGQWNSVTLPPVQVTGGTGYWLALLGVNGVVQFRDRRGMCQSEVSRQTNLGSLPATWATGSRWSTCIVSMFESGSVTSGGLTPSVGISISPRNSSLQAGQQQQFAAVVSGLSNTTVVWTASGGTVNRSGLYTAPSSAGTYTITAKAIASRRTSNSTVVASASAIATVAQPTPTPVPSIQVSVSPTGASIGAGKQQQFTAAVSGTSNTAVAWSASGGTVSSVGLYTAPEAAGTYTLTAVSNADPTKSASARITVSTPPAVTVAISPASASVRSGNQLQFTATVSGVSSTAVTWAVITGSGTITQSGLFTAPNSTESDVITATTQDRTKSASASIAVLAPHSVALNWRPSPSTDVASYRVYRGTLSGGPYTLLGTNIRGTGYTDSSVQSGGTYYYVTTAVDTAGTESIFSNELPSVIPSP